MNDREAKIEERTGYLQSDRRIVVNDEGRSGYEVYFDCNGMRVVWRLWDMEEVLRLVRVLSRTAMG